MKKAIAAGFTLAALCSSLVVAQDKGKGIVQNQRCTNGAWLTLCSFSVIACIIASQTPADRSAARSAGERREIHGTVRA
jgi:hypothetical protein